jgi:hypothetical protein
MMRKGLLKSVLSKQTAGNRTRSRKAPASRKSYWERRQHLMYYKYVDVLVRVFGAHARSVIDVGSRDTRLLEEFDWIPERHALDISEPYQSRNVRGIKADFLTFSPAERYDLALCLQVLEHVPDPTGFAQHLFEVAENVLVSVPFMWDEGAKSHIHDPVSREKLVAWTGREPSYEILVSEPLHTIGTSRRLIAYYHSKGQEFSLPAARRQFRAVRGTMTAAMA